MKTLSLRNCQKACVVVALMLGQHMSAVAQTLPAGDPAATLNQVQQNLADSASKQQALTADLEAAIKAEAEISDKLIALGKTLNDQQAATTVATQKLEKLKSEAIIIRSNLAEKQDALSALLVGLQRLEQNPPPALVVEPKNVLQALRGAMMFGAVVPEMRDQAASLQGDLQRLEAIKTETESARKTAEDTLAALATSQSELTALQAQKKALAAASAKNLESEKRRAADLANQAKTLQQLLSALEAAKAHDEALKTAEARAQEEAERLKREAMAKPAMQFSLARGKLDYPVQGAILKQFGDDNSLGGTLDGLAIGAASDANVISPVDGKVEFAGPFRSYGQLLILNAGEGYLVLLAGMKQISAEIGQSVKAGEPLGRMGEGPSSVALIGNATDNAHPVLYVEFRKNNDPVDPTPWWIGGRKEAMK